MSHFYLGFNTILSITLIIGILLIFIIYTFRLNKPKIDYFNKINVKLLLSLYKEKEYC